MKKTKKSTDGTSFFNETFCASVKDLRKILGEPNMEQNDGSDKVNFEWEMENENGDVFTVYDWKEYRRISENENIEWHIGGDNENVTSVAINEIAGELNDL